MIFSFIKPITCHKLPKTLQIVPYKLQTKMNVPIKEDEIILTPEQQERMYWAKIKYDSHKWIEYHKGYYKCEFCDLIHTSMLSFETVNICKKNPNLFPMDNQTPNP